MIVVATTLLTISKKMMEKSKKQVEAATMEAKERKKRKWRLIRPLPILSRPRQWFPLKVLSSCVMMSMEYLWLQMQRLDSITRSI